MEKHLSNSVFAAFLLWFAMFSPWTSAQISFWGMMLSSAVLLAVLSFWYGRDVWKERVENWRRLYAGKYVVYGIQQVVIGLAVAGGLWAICWLGGRLAEYVLPGMARAQVDSLYAVKGDWDAAMLSVVLFFIVAPAEEIFWRGYVQETLCRWVGNSTNKQWVKNASLVGCGLSTALYVLIHLSSLNLMLILAALFCGGVWGALYWWRPNWLPAIVLSHGIWDVAVFVCFPL